MFYLRLHFGGSGSLSYNGHIVFRKKLIERVGSSSIGNTISTVKGFTKEICVIKSKRMKNLTMSTQVWYT